MLENTSYPVTTTTTTTTKEDKFLYENNHGHAKLTLAEKRAHYLPAYEIGICDYFGQFDVTEMAINVR